MLSWFSKRETLPTCWWFSAYRLSCWAEALKLRFPPYDPVCRLNYVAPCVHKCILVWRVLLFYLKISVSQFAYLKSKQIHNCFRHAKFVSTGYFCSISGKLTNKLITLSISLTNLLQFMRTEISFKSSKNVFPAFLTSAWLLSAKISWSLLIKVYRYVCVCVCVCVCAQVCLFACRTHWIDSTVLNIW